MSSRVRVWAIGSVVSAALVFGGLRLWAGREQHPPTCSGPSLELAVVGTAPGAGMAVTDIIIVNRGRPCVLFGYPQLWFFDESGQEVKVRLTRARRSPVRVRLMTDTKPIADRPYRAQGQIAFTVFRDDGKRRPVKTIEVSLPGVTTRFRVDALGFTSEGNRDVSVSDNVSVLPITGDRS